MAQGKKSFVAYADWKDVFDELPDSDAGALIKHIFAYVNDENPTTDSVLIKAVFANIKSTLKRDLNKWESQVEQRSLAGKKSAEKRALTKNNEIERNPTVVEIRARNPTVSDNVSVNVNVSEKVILLEKETKDIKKGKSLSLNPKIKDIEERRKDFNESLKPFFVQYGFQMMESFYNYWAELTMDKKKMRFEIQKTWETNLRLATWSKNNIKFNNNGTTNNTKSGQATAIQNQRQDYD